MKEVLEYLSTNFENREMINRGDAGYTLAMSFTKLSQGMRDGLSDQHQLKINPHIARHRAGFFMESKN